MGLVRRNAMGKVSKGATSESVEKKRAKGSGKDTRIWAA
jgi:hypothetical protein